MSSPHHLNRSVKKTSYITLVLLSVWGCTSAQDSTSSSQTHWLSACDENSDCGDLSCECGVCTQTCNSDSACSSLDEDARCASANSLSACRANQKRVCLQSCEASCSAGSECREGSCVPVPSEGEPEGSEPSPEELDASNGTEEPEPSSTPNGPAGVQCGNFEPCGVNTPCTDGSSCISLPGCGGAICIEHEEACKASCPDPSMCLLLESYPLQIACEGRVDGIPADPEPEAAEPEVTEPGVEEPESEPSPDHLGDCLDEGGICLPEGNAAPPTYRQEPGAVCAEGVCWVSLSSSEPESQAPEGVQCGDYSTCGPAADCGPAEDCIQLTGCESAICIAAEEACSNSCPDASECVVAESFPLQIGCPGLIEATPADTTSVDLSLLNSDCSDSGTCPPGLTALTYYGIAGASGPEFCTCSIPCSDKGIACPDGSSCVTIADGPGQVCVANETPATFACGSEDCMAAEEYCVEFSGGAAPPPDAAPNVSYSCNPFPESCQASPTCDCLESAGELGPGSCQEDGAAVLVQVFAP